MSRNLRASCRLLGFKMDDSSCTPTDRSIIGTVTGLHLNFAPFLFAFRGRPIGSGRNRPRSLRSSLQRKLSEANSRRVRGPP